MGLKRIEREVREVVEPLIQDGWTAAEIRHELESKSLACPPDRTLQRWVREGRKVIDKDDSAPWKLADSENARTVLDVLAVAITHNGGYKRRITNLDADWIIRVRKAAPTLDFYAVWRLANLYKVRTLNDQDTIDLDMFLAFAPWEGQEARGTYLEALNYPGVDAAPLLLDIDDLDPLYDPDAWMKLQQPENDF